VGAAQHRQVGQLVREICQACNDQLQGRQHHCIAAIF